MTAPWQLQAACRPGTGHPPDLWYPSQGDIHTRDAALAICATCPVRQQCAETALRTGEPDGIWGGLTARQRTELLGDTAHQRRIETRRITAARRDGQHTIWCEHGTISQTWTCDADPGVITGMGPLLLFADPITHEIANLGAFGVHVTVRDGIARTQARNGTWLHRLQSAHWATGRPPDGWVEHIQLGRWPD